MDTLATMSLSASKLAAGQGAIASPTLLNQMATLKSSPDLVAWLEADTCYMASGSNAGWRDRITGGLFLPSDGLTYPTQGVLSAFNNQEVIEWASAGAKDLNDGGANLFQGGNNSFSFVIVAAQSTAANVYNISDDQSPGSVTGLFTQTGGNVNFTLDGTGIDTYAPGNTLPFIAIFSYQYGAGSTSAWKTRVNSGAHTNAATGVAATAVGGKLTIAGYNSDGGSSNGAQVALVMFFKNAILHGTYASQQYSNWSNELYYQILEAYAQTKYGVP